jgi:cytochrome c oxidase assembly protein subunit 15
MHPTPEIEPQHPAPRPHGDARLARGFQALVALTFCLIVLGALVRANGAGLACPDWPLCFGNFIPEIDVQVGFEWSHRLLAGSVTAVFALIALAAWRSPARTRYEAKLIVLAATLLAIQITLGALTVWLKLAPWTVTAHLITGNSFASACFLLALAFRTQSGAEESHAPVSARKRFAMTALACVLLIQLAIGGLVSSQYAGMACPEWPTCNGGVWFPTWGGSVGLHILHRLCAYALIVGLGAAAFCCRRDARLRKVTALAFALGILQASLGAASVVNGIPAELTGLHTGLAAALVLALVYALQRAWSANDEVRTLATTH